MLRQLVEPLSELSSIDGVLDFSGRVAVGLRPMRQDGFRIDAKRKSKGVVVHNYGHGGAGVTLAWGCAAEVVRLAVDALDLGPTGLGGSRRSRPRRRVEDRCVTKCLRVLNRELGVRLVHTDDAGTGELRSAGLGKPCARRRAPTPGKQVVLYGESGSASRRSCRRSSRSSTRRTSPRVQRGVHLRRHRARCLRLAPPVLRRIEQVYGQQALQASLQQDLVGLKVALEAQRASVAEVTTKRVVAPQLDSAAARHRARDGTHVLGDRGFP